MGQQDSGRGIGVVAVDADPPPVGRDLPRPRLGGGAELFDEAGAGPTIHVDGEVETAVHPAQLVGGGVLDDGAVFDDDGALGEVLRLGEVVGGEDDGPAAFGLGAHDVPELAPGGGVHARGGLVKDQQVGVGQEGKCEAHVLLLTSGELADDPPAHVGQLGLLEDGPVVHVRVVGGAEEAEGLGHGVVDGQGARLEDDADQGAPYRVARRQAEHAGGARGRGLQAEDDVDQGGLPGAVLAEQRHDLAPGDVQAEGVEGADLPVVFRHLLH